MTGASQLTNDGIVSALLALAGSQELRRRAEEGCRVWLRSAANDGDLGGLSLEEVEIQFERCALVFDHCLLEYPFVETRLGLFVADPTGVSSRGLRPVGHYRLITRLDGSVDDDYFVLETGGGPP